MGMLIFILIFSFVIGGLLILLRSANSHKIPVTAKLKSYNSSNSQIQQKVKT